MQNLNEFSVFGKTETQQIKEQAAIVRTRVAGESIDADHSFSVIDVKTAVNAAEKDYIWEYDPTADKLTQGAEFVGGINYILRLEKTEDVFLSQFAPLARFGRGVGGEGKRLILVNYFTVAADLTPTPLIKQERG